MSSTGSLHSSVEGRTRAERFDSHLAQICSLEVDKGIRPFRMTSVICTIGPACDDVATLEEMILAGMNICRLNMAHNSLEYHEKVIHNIRQAVHNTKSPSPVAIAVEIAGQGVRTGRFLPELGKEVNFKKNEEVVLTNEPGLENSCDRSTLWVNSGYFLQEAQPGQTILLSDGLLSLLVKEKMEGDRILTVVSTEGIASNKCHVHIPQVLPAPENKLTEGDKNIIKFAMEHNVDMIFAAWVWTAELVTEIRELLGDKGALMKIVANIENRAAIKNFDSILEVADGIMVARGDLGMDLAPEKVFIAQKNLIGRANAAGKPVICAAQMLESMSANPRPTRAEANDVANAILDGTDCVMLSRETAVGKAPVRALRVICSIAREAEMAVHHDRLYRQLRVITPLPADSVHSTAMAAVEAASHSKASAIIVVTSTGHSAAMVARYRPPCLIVAVTKSHHTVRALHLHRSVYPVLHDAASCEEWTADVDFRIHHAMRICKKRGYFGTGCTCILVTGSMQGAGWTNTIRTIVVPDLDEEPQHYLNIASQSHLGI
ncbi:pyruvate kinase PKM-like [Babylonia areolata]|uniref:pyruvate kinase PKM-like n=1 Tax=Babylonia areolata TaxID=304850 RepID=UPI003FCF5490